MMLKQLENRQKLLRITKQLLKAPGASMQFPLEIAIVIDGNVKKATAVQITKELAELLKQSDQRFQNIRVNLLIWSSDLKIDHQTGGLSLLMLERTLEGYVQRRKKKQLSGLLEYLRVFQARAKIIYVLTDNQFEAQEPQVDTLLQPFVGRKTVWLDLSHRPRHFQQKYLELKEDNMDTIIHNFAPVFNQDSKYLMLGTIPSPKSREQGFYYGHPRNRFWKVIADIFGEPLPGTVEEKIALCYRHRLAVWDVLASCEIAGASDSSIKKEVPNDMTVIFNYAPIQGVFTTGMKAYQLYQKYCYPVTNMAAIALPSTSPANCQVSYEQLRAAYQKALGCQ